MRTDRPEAACLVKPLGFSTACGTAATRACLCHWRKADKWKGRARLQTAMAASSRSRMHHDGHESLAQITHVIFDMDGLLLDTEGFYTQVQKRILQRYGKEFTWELKAKMMGKKALEAAQVCVRELGLGDQLTAEDFLAEREEALDKLFPDAQLMPGAERLLRHLHARGVPFCLATSSHQRHYELKTGRHTELFSLFHHRITGDQVTNGKPAPEMFLTAAAAFSPPATPGCCLVFEDAIAGVAAGKAAGMHVVMVPDPNLRGAQAAGADMVLQTLEDFQPEQWGLPALSDTAQDAAV